MIFTVGVSLVPPVSELLVVFDSIADVIKGHGHFFAFFSCELIIINTICLNVSVKFCSIPFQVSWYLLPKFVKRVFVPINSNSIS